MSKKDHVIAGGLALCAVVGVVGTYATATVNQVDRSTAATMSVQPAAQETWGGVSVAGVGRPVVAKGMVAVPTEHGVQVLAASSGQQAWHYERADRTLCALATLGDEFVVTFAGPSGCGETTMFEAQTGRITQQRSGMEPQSAYPLPMAGSSKAGLVSPQRVETWGSNLVRLTEYGDVEAPAEAGYQPNPECEILTAQATESVVALTERCESDVMLRVIAAQSSDSRKPEVKGELKVDSVESASVVAVSDSAVVLYSSGQLTRYSINSTPSKGKSSVALRKVEQVPVQQVEESAAAMGAADVVATSTISQWWDGHRTWIFEGKQLVAHEVENTLGTGAIVGGRVVVPTKDGLADVDPKSGSIVSTRTVPAAREAGIVRVDVTASGSTLVEQRMDASGGRTVWGFAS